MFQYGPTPGGPGQWYVHHDTWWQSAGHLLPLVLFAILIGVVIWAVLRTTSSRAAIAAAPAVAPPPPVDNALQELRVRYARGDISREDYLERSADLGLAGGPAPAPETPPQE